MPPKTKSSKGSSETSARRVAVIKDGDRRWELAEDEIGPADHLACRQQTGLPLEQFLLHEGADSVLVMIWLARRKSGEPNLAFQKVVSEYPTTKAINRIELDVPDDEVEDIPLADEE